MSKRFMYYCIAINERGILHCFGSPVLFQKKGEAKQFLCSDDVLKWQSITGISQAELSIKRVALDSVGW